MLGFSTCSLTRPFMSESALFLSSQYRRLYSMSRVSQPRSRDTDPHGFCNLGLFTSEDPSSPDRSLVSSQEGSVP